jgi:hypothetical protein
MQGRRILRIPMRRDQDFNVLIESHEKTQEALYGKLPQLAAQHLGHVGLPDAEQIGCLDLFQATLSHERVDFADQLGLDEVLVCIPHAEVFAFVPMAAFLSFPGHGSLPYELRLSEHWRYSDITIFRRKANDERQK